MSGPAAQSSRESSSMHRSYRVAPAAEVRGQIQLPGDKSISHRALMLGGIAEGDTAIEGFLASEDCLATLAALRALGVSIERPSETQVRVRGAGLAGLTASAAPLDMGNAGTAIRLFMGLLAGQRFDSQLIGDASLSRRPMQRVAAPLERMGARIETQQGRPPVRIHGGAQLHGIDYELPIASAQVKSALLLAGLYARGTTQVTEPAPTRDHTERMLRGFGVTLEREALDEQAGRTRIGLVGGQRLQGRAIVVPADFSSAAFFIVAGCLAAREPLRLRSVGCNPTRTGLLTMLQLMGARIEVEAHAAAGSADAGVEPVADLLVHRSRLRGIRVPEHLVPLSIDEFPAFFIAAAAAEGETVVTGASELRVKESDRLAVMAEGLKRLGIDCELLEDGIRIRGGSFRGGRVDSHGDHRIAMAFAIASLRASAPIEIEDVANVATSFPGFPTLARAAGLRLRELP
jgi:3-phosphoshikimate 1-carboxyvinyltransferase